MWVYLKGLGQRQRDRWQEHEEKLLTCMSDYEKWTAVKLQKILGLSRSRIYAHLYELNALGRVARDGSEFWLTPLGNLPQAMTSGVNRVAHAIPKERLQVEVTQKSDSRWSATVSPDGIVLFKLQLIDGVQVSERKRKKRPWNGIRLIRRVPITISECAITAGPDTSQRGVGGGSFEQGRHFPRVLSDTRRRPLFFHAWNPWNCNRETLLSWRPDTTRGIQGFSFTSGITFAV